MRTMRYVKPASERLAEEILADRARKRTRDNIAGGIMTFGCVLPLLCFFVLMVAMGICGGR